MRCDGSALLELATGLAFLRALQALVEEASPVPAGVALQKVTLYEVPLMPEIGDFPT